MLGLNDFEILAPGSTFPIHISPIYIYVWISQSPRFLPGVTSWDCSVVKHARNLFCLCYREISTTVSRTNKESISLSIASFTIRREGRVLRMQLEVEPVGQWKVAPGSHEVFWCLAGAKPWPAQSPGKPSPAPDPGSRAVTCAATASSMPSPHCMWLFLHCGLFSPVSGTRWVFTSFLMTGEMDRASLSTETGRTGVRLQGIWNYSASACHIT